MSLSSKINSRYAGMSRSQLIVEITRLENLVRSKDNEIESLKKRISLYRSLS